MGCISSWFEIFCLRSRLRNTDEYMAITIYGERGLLFYNPEGTTKPIQTRIEDSFRETNEPRLTVGLVEVINNEVRNEISQPALFQSSCEHLSY